MLPVQYFAGPPPDRLTDRLLDTLNPFELLEGLGELILFLLELLSSL